MRYQHNILIRIFAIGDLKLKPLIIKNSKALILIFICVITWGSSYVAIKIGLEGYSPNQLAAFRFFIAAIALLPVFLWRKMKVPSLKEFAMIVIISLVGIMGYHLALNYSTVNYAPNSVSFVANSAPIFITILSGLLLKEKTSVMGWVGLFIGLLGVWIMNANSETIINWDIGLLLVIPITSAIFFVLQKPLLNKMHPFEVMVYTIIIGALLLLVYDYSFLENVLSAPLQANIAVIYLGIIPTALAFNIWASVLSKVDVSYASRFLYLVPVSTVVFSYLLLGQVPLTLTLIGGGVILTGVYLSTRK